MRVRVAAIRPSSFAARATLAVWLCCVWPAGPQAFAADPPFELDEMVVTGTRPATTWHAPRSIAVITASDIARSPSGNLVDLLAREANVNLRSFFGNDKFAGVDIRGMGDTFTSNVLVLVDGVRLNAVDLSGADFSSIPLDQIERIEVVRGANAVRYGSGAVGGVINIRTRRPQGAARANGGLTAGSFDSYGSRVALGASRSGLDLDAQGSLYDSDGYRDNSAFDRKDGALALRYHGLPWLEAYARAELHEDRYGMPGPLDRFAFERSDRARRQANAPHDGGRTMDRRYRAGARIDGGTWGELSGLASYRNRTNPFVIGFSPLLGVREQESTIESISRHYEATHSVPLGLFGRQHELVLGFEHDSADYERRENGRGLVDRSRSLVGRLSDHSGFVSSHWSLPHGFAAELGYRHDLFGITRREEHLRRVCETRFIDTVVDTTVFVEIAPGVIIPISVPVTVSLPIESNCRSQLQITRGQDDSWRNEAFEAGLNWAPTDWASAYASYHRSFRNPNVDELTLATGELGPQRGRHWELGLRLRSAARLEAALALFDMRVEDEILFGFDPVLQRNVNRNLDGGTVRRGVELELKAVLTATLDAWTNLSYIDARIADDDAFIPLVPREKIAAGIEWSPVPTLSLAAACTYVGTRADGNDFGAAGFPDVPAYHVVDAKLRWRLPHASVAAGVSNVLDAVYATAGYSGTVYPMPPRSYLFELAFEL